MNLSDGGHIENLGVYELLRRQCKYIVCVDAGMDGEMSCEDLIRLQRYASIDFGIRLHFDASELARTDAEGRSLNAILVKIDYAPPEDARTDRTSDQLGWMLYIKPAVIGGEPDYVEDYKRKHPTFPHETTADQWFDEDQFEAYRALGECAVDHLCDLRTAETAPDAGAPANGNVQKVELPELFRRLCERYLPDNDPVFSEA